MTADLSFSSRYSIISSIGSGGMGEVFKARDNFLNCDVAIKIIHAETGNNPRMRKCFAREARAFNLLHHPNIIDIYDCGLTDSEQLYITMELVQGPSVHQIQSDCFTPAMVKILFGQILDALSAAHARGLAHCDLKTENVLMTLQNNAILTKLVDFGLATLPFEITDSHEISFGTPAYMAPEQILKQTKLIGACTDIYAAGIILFEAVTGHLPFDAPSAVELMKSQLNASVPEIDWLPQFQSLSDATKEGLTQIIHTALHKTPWKRFISAKAFKDAFFELDIPDTLNVLDPIIAILREYTDCRDISTSHPGIITGDIGCKIRAIEAAQDSGLRWPPDKSFPSEEIPEDSVLPKFSESLDVFFALNDAESSAKFSNTDKFLTEFAHLKEYAILQKDAERALLGFGTLRVISGGFGLGKTKLLKYFSSRCLMGKFYTITCPASQYSSSSPKKLSADETTNAFFQKLILQLSSALPETQSKHSQSDYHRTGHTSEAKLTEGLKQKNQEKQPIDESLCSSLIEYITKIITEITSSTPLAILIDDIQRCTEPVYHLLKKLRTVVDRLPVLILVTQDPHELSNNNNIAKISEAETFSSVFGNKIVLEPLDSATMAQMLKSCSRLDDRLSHRIAQTSFGNPYYAIALIHHLNQSSRLIKTKQNLLTLDPKDNQPLGVPHIAAQFFRKKLNEIALLQGSQSDFYKEILVRLSSFGYETTMSEAEAFWKLDEDKALSAYWREALQSWTDMNMLTQTQCIGENGRPDFKISFTEPWHADVLQSELSIRRIRALKAQTANALVECYTNPTAQQSWKIAQLWRAAADSVSFVQSCQQSANTAYDNANLKFAFERNETLASAFDAMMNTLEVSKDILHAIHWPTSLILGAELSLILNKSKEFDHYCDRLKTWHEQFNEPVYLAHIQRLNAKKQLRKGQLPRAAEIARLSQESFEICNAPKEAVRSLIILADIQELQNDPRNAKQLLYSALPPLAKTDECIADIANIQMRLAKLEWFSGNQQKARQFAQNAVLQFDKIHDYYEKAQAKLILDMLSYLNMPDSIHYQALIDDYPIQTSLGDECASACAGTCMLIAATLQCDRTTIHCLCDQNTIQSPYSTLLSGTQSCVRAIDLISSDQHDEADNEITMAIASFGPQNRRARAWCHTLLGLHAALTKQLRDGAQSFERAKNDFQALSDNIGIATVLLGQSALADACGQYDDAFAMAMDAIHEAHRYQLYLHALFAFVIAADAGIHIDNLTRSELVIPEQIPQIPPCFIQFLNQKFNRLYEAIQYNSKTGEAKHFLEKLLDISPDVQQPDQSIGYPSVEITF